LSLATGQNCALGNAPQAERVVLPAALDVHGVNTLARQRLRRLASASPRIRSGGITVGSLDSNSRESTRITLGLLEAVEAGRAQTQRGLAKDLGIALGLVNVYLKRCVKKGLVKVSQAPARRFAYYITPKGFAEKSRLTAEYLSWSLSFFRLAKSSCSQVLGEARTRGWQRIALAGAGDLADIARLCAPDHGLTVIAIVDPDTPETMTGGLPVLHGFDTIADQIDGAVVTALGKAPAMLEAAKQALGHHRVLTPSVVTLPVEDEPANSAVQPSPQEVAR